MSPTVPSITRRTLLVVIAGLMAVAGPAGARLAGQQTTPPPPAPTTQTAPATGQRGGGRGVQGPIDEQRARQLYVSNKFEIIHGRISRHKSTRKPRKTPVTTPPARASWNARRSLTGAALATWISPGCQVPAAQPARDQGACRHGVGPRRSARQLEHFPDLPGRLQGPNHQRDFSTQKEVLGLPFEKRALYVQRSPLYHVDKLKVPVLVHVATNDTDVDFVEDQQIVDALRSRKPDLAETKIYVDPDVGLLSGGHTFSRRTNTETLQREDSPAQIDSWNRTWVFFEWNL